MQPVRAFIAWVVCPHCGWQEVGEHGFGWVKYSAVSPVVSCLVPCRAGDLTLQQSTPKLNSVPPRHAWSHKPHPGSEIPSLLPNHVWK